MTRSKRNRLLCLTLTASRDDGYWETFKAKRRLETALTNTLGDVLRETRGNVTLTLELWKERV